MLPDDLKDRLGFIIHGGYSKRFHTVDTLRTQDISQHSFGVAWLCELLSGMTASKNLIMAALAHDLAEHQVGDVPSPTKRSCDVIYNALEKLEEERIAGVGLLYVLTPDEQRILKLADILDGMIFCLHERQLGNRTTHLRVVYGNFLSYSRLLDRSVDEVVFFNYINEQWRELNERSK
jgi:5'-deoxynucleotidase YfbR-like HD superfamily hydrolase